MEQLALSALVDVCNNGVLEASRAVLRLNAMPEDKVTLIMEDDSAGPPGPDNLLKDEILKKHGVNPGKLDEEVKKTLVAGSVKPLVAHDSRPGHSRAT